MTRLRRKRTTLGARGGIGLGTALGMGCAAFVACAPQLNERATSVPRPAEPSTSATGAPPPESSREAVERERPGHSREADPGHVATRLPFDPAFVAASLPNGDVRRYAGWRQAGQTAIGKGYLYFLEAFNAGRWLIVKSADDVSVRILDAKTRAQLFSWPVQNLAADEAHVILPWTGGGPPQVLVGKNDGLWIYAADSGDVGSQLSDTPTTSARWSRDGSLLMTSEAAIPEQTSRFRIYQRQPTDTLTLLSELAVSERVDGWDLSRDNRFLARNFYPSERTTVLDLATGQTLLDVPSPRYAGSVEFSPDGRWLAMGGSGVKWLDVSNPTRRTEYTYFYNNVADVEFSPSGDVLVATSYDGSVRLLAYDEPANRLELVTTFRHQINTNVYAARFLEQGNLLVTSAGDRTVRYWSGKNGAADSPTEARWRDPFSWLSWGAQRDPGYAPTALQIPVGERYVPPRLQKAPLPSRIKPGSYACKVTEIYKLRDCTVELDAQGHTLLEFHKENLLGFRGVLFDDGPVVRFEGWLTDAGSLGCATCAQQPLHAVFRGQGRNWNGLLLYKGHYDPWVPSELPAADAKFEEAIDRFPLKLVGK